MGKVTDLWAESVGVTVTEQQTESVGAIVEILSGIPQFATGIKVCGGERGTHVLTRTSLYF